LCTREHEAGKKEEENTCGKKIFPGCDNRIEPASKEVTVFAVQFDLKFGESSLQR
jgi:hypothetical protein